jgi:hypothetical protein
MLASFVFHVLPEFVKPGFSCFRFLTSYLILLASKFLPIAALIFLSLFPYPRTSYGQTTSLLWGESGELWTPQSRLPDFSFAGYRSGGTPIPDVAVKGNVKDFGAKGDGVTDDSQAFLKAISSVSNGAILVPAGRYLITEVLFIKKSNVVLRGEGPDKTVLYFPKPLEDILGGYWSWTGGVIWVEGKESGSKLANVTAEALRGDTTLTVSSTSKIKAGQMIRLVQYENGGSLGSDLHADEQNGGSCLAQWTKGRLVDWAAKVAAVQGKEITLERPLRVDVHLGWSPEVHSHKPAVQEVGIEGLSIEFPDVKYAGHFKEPGYNAINFRNVSNSWVRNVTIVNADGGIYLEGPSTRFNTVQGIRFTGRGGHHGTEADRSQDNLITDFSFENTFLHDITVQLVANGNVFSKGEGVNINFDHHRAAPYENLFSDIDAGKGSRLWDSGGDTCAGPNSGARETFWNVRKGSGSALSSVPDWPQINVIGAAFSDMTQEGRWVEGLDPASLFPQDLHESQLARRLGGQPLSNPALTASSNSPPSSYLQRVNAGGSSYTDGAGNKWSADQSYRSGSWGYTGGKTYKTSDPIDNTEDDPLYQSERYGNFSYKFDVPNGQYDVVLHFAEIYWQAAGQRSFDVKIEGVSVLNDYDIVAAVGSDVAVTQTFPGVVVTDGQLNIDFITVVNNAKVSAVSVASSAP